MPGSLLAQEEGAAEVDAQNPIKALLCHLQNIASLRRCDARIVDKQIQTAVLRENRIQRGLPLRLIRYIAPVLLLIILVFYTLAQFGVIQY